MVFEGGFIMKKAIVILAIVLLPAAAFGWTARDNAGYDGRYDGRYSQEQEMMDSQRNVELGRMADEARYANEYREYQDQMRDYDAQYPPGSIERFTQDHYYKGPRAPKR